MSVDLEKKFEMKKDDLHDKILMVIDIETSGLDRFKDKILGIGVYNPTDQQFFDDSDSFNAWLQPRLSKTLFVMHNGSFDTNFLRSSGVDISSNYCLDTCALASILIPRPGSLGLEALALQYLNEAPYKLDRKNMASYSQEEIKNYCLKDCRLTWELHELFLTKMDQKSLLFARHWLLPAVKFLTQMEYDGVYVDKEGLKLYNEEMVAKRNQVLTELKELSKEAIKHYHEIQTREMSKHYKEMYEKAKTKNETKKPFEKFGENTKLLRRYALLESAAISRLEPFNWNSPKQLIWLLKDYYQIVIKDRDNEDSTAEAVLRSNNHPVCQKLCDYRETEKLVSTCIPALQENLDENSFVHTHYHIGGTRTGRLSSSSPNLQQIPRGKLRSYVQASSRTHTLATIDYSQIEVRIIAEVSKEKELINAFKEGIDPYSVIAQKLLKIDCPVREIKTRFKKERDVSKTAGLSILYGTGARKLQEVLNKELNKNYKLDECRRFIEDYRASLPAVRDFKQKLEQALANQKVYHNLLGRPFIIESNEDLYMKSLNTLVQGSASDLVMHSAIKVKQKLQDLGCYNKCRLIIHDETVWELEKDEAELLVKDIIIPTMTLDIEQELRLTVPLAVEYNINKVWEKP